MKSKAQKYAEAIERNAKHRSKYILEAEERFPNDTEKQQAYADQKQGIRKTRR